MIVWVSLLPCESAVCIADCPFTYHAAAKVSLVILNYPTISIVGKSDGDMFPDFVPHTPLSSPKIPFHMRHDLCSKIMRVKLAHNGHDIEVLAITFKTGECASR